VTNAFRTSADVKALFGLAPKDKWPSSGLAPIVVEAFTVWVDPLDSVPVRRRRMRHRALARCHICGQTLSAGRIGQHRCKAGA
jgi:hypothetical protein